MKSLLFTFNEQGIRSAFNEVVRKITLLERRGDSDDLAPKRLSITRTVPANPTDGMIRFNGIKLFVWNGTTSEWVEV